MLDSKTVSSTATALGVKRRLPKGFVMKPNGLAKIRGTELQP